MLLNYHIGRLVLSSLCVGDLVRLVLSGVGFAGFSLQNENHLKPAAPKPSCSAALETLLRNARYVGCNQLHAAESWHNIDGAFNWTRNFLDFRRK